MRIIAVDDERLALENIVSVLQKAVPQAQVDGFMQAENALQFLAKNSADIAVLDIRLPGMHGIELAKRCKDLCPSINIVFATGYSEYAMTALQMHVSGYLLKPVSEDDVRREFADLRHPIVLPESKLYVQTFGNFEVYSNGKPLRFMREKSKECFAYLVDRKGAGVTGRELSAVLWEGKTDSESLQSSTRKIVSDMLKSLADAGVSSAVIKYRNRISVDVSKIDCDYYRVLAGDIRRFNSFTGEYMSNYSWAEFTLGALIDKLKKSSR